MTNEHLKYLDSIINAEELRSEEYSHERRRYSISRSGRFKSKNKKRDALEQNLFDDNFNKQNSNNNIKSSGNQDQTPINDNNNYSSHNSNYSYNPNNISKYSNNVGNYNYRGQQSNYHDGKTKDKHFETNL